MNRMWIKEEQNSLNAGNCTGKSTGLETQAGCGGWLGLKKDSSGYHSQLALSTGYNNVGS